MMPLNPPETEALDEHVRVDTMDADWQALSQRETDAVIRVQALARGCGSDPGTYHEGVLELTFLNKQAAINFVDELDEIDDVFGYDIDAYREVKVDGYVEDEPYDLDDVLFDKDFEFVVTVYLNPEIVTYSQAEDEVDEDYEDENGFVFEVRRRIKVNSQGKRRIKMQCRPGFKWDAEAKVCKKITGAEVAMMRRAHRKASRTKKAMGQSFKVRILRKSRKARRFRKSMGLK